MSRSQVHLAALAVSFLLVRGPLPAVPGAGPPFLATGIRVGEVGPHGALVWARLTRSARRVQPGKTAAGAGSASGDRLDLPPGWRIEELEGACPGAPGSARVVWSASTDLREAAATPWREARPEEDFTLQFALGGLRPGSRYHLRVETRDPEGRPGASLTGSFRTAPPAESEEPVTFTAVTGMMARDLDDPEGFRIHPAMASLEPDFLVATGDSVYYDSEWPRARGVELARFHWHRMLSLPRLLAFHRQVPGYWIKDDHDTLDDDCWPGKRSTRVAPLTFEEGRRIFREEVPVGEKTYRTVRWGRHLQVWFVEGRDFRSPNPEADGPAKTIWGEEQKRWLEKTLLESDATFRVLASATPVVGPDRPRGKRDNHANGAFRHEGEWFRNWVREHLPDRFYVVCGDRHWQYHSVHPRTGVEEFSCGPASDEHAGGSPGLDPRFHRFHRVGGGFLSVRAGREGAQVAITFRFHDSGGGVVYEHREEAFSPEELAFPAGGSGAGAREARTFRDDPLYARLLEEARERLAERARAAGALADRAAIGRRSAWIRKTLLDSFGGFPERTPLEARITGRLEREDHAVEKVIFESRPEFHVTANLYLPRRGAPPYPAILFPCGHAANGKAGSTYQTAGQELARRGFAVFIYDPIGQGERFQFLDANGRPLAGGTTEHTLTGAAALLVGSSTAEVIIWDGIRAADYLEERDDIDIERLGATGNSGGGTQTSYLMALEPRIRAAAPSCYLTSFTRLLETIGPQDAEQNFTGFIRDGLDHADFVHAFSPRPALICAASEDFFDIRGTWETFREAKRLYERLGRAEAVDLVEVPGKHGYQPAIRQRVGRFFEESLLGRPRHQVVPLVPEGAVYPDAELQCTLSGQVVADLQGRTVADLWREREARLRPERERLCRELDRTEWLRRVRQLAGMAERVAVPRVSPLGSIARSGLVVEKLSWDEGFPVTALLFHREGAPEGARGGIEIVASDRGKEALAARLSGRARGGGGDPRRRPSRLRRRGGAGGSGRRVGLGLEGGLPRLPPEEDARRDPRGRPAPGGGLGAGGGRAGRR